MAPSVSSFATWAEFPVVQGEGKFAAQELIPRTER